MMGTSEYSNPLQISALRGWQRRACRVAGRRVGHRRMTPNSPFPPLDAEQEISLPIESLQRTERRLAELTGGEVDTVASQEGRILLLRRAQDRMRRNVAANQATILNALPANIALLDSEGQAISVNAAWQRFAEQNGLQASEAGLGLNYIEACSVAQGVDASQAQRVGEGIRSVCGSGGGRNRGTIASVALARLRPDAGVSVLAERFGVRANESGRTSNER